MEAVRKRPQEPKPAAGKRHSTAGLNRFTDEFTITHPFHPMKGKTFKFFERKIIWGDDRILYEKEPGHKASIPTNFTNISEEDPFIAVSNGRSHMTFDSMISLFEIIKAIGKS